MRKILLNVPLDDLSIADIIQKVRRGDRIFQIFINVHKINHFNSDVKFAKYFNYDWTVFSPDGVPIQWYARLKGFRTRQRFGGVDVIETFSKLSENEDFKIYFLGSTKEVLSKCIESLKCSYPKIKIAGYQHGYFDDESKVLEDIKSSKASILFIALPSPRKEMLGHQFFEKAPQLQYVAGVGGAFSIFSRDSKRAPSFIQTIGMEWLYRTALEPKRLFMRYWNDGVTFIKLIIDDKNK